MPIYEFICQECQHEFEKFTWTDNPENVQCPKCKSLNCQKLFSGFSCGSSCDTSSGGFR